MYGEVIHRDVREQNGKNRITFPHSAVFDVVRYTIDGVVYSADVEGNNIVGPYIISGKLGKKGDGNKNGYIHFAKNLDKKTKVYLEKNSGGLRPEINQVKKDVAHIKECARRVIIGEND